MKKLSEINKVKKQLKAPSNRAFDKKYITTIEVNEILTSEQLNQSFIDETMKHIKLNFRVNCNDLRTIHEILKKGVLMY